MAGVYEPQRVYHKCHHMWYTGVMTDSVKTSLRIPRELYDRLKRAADRNHRSVSNLVLHYVTTGVEQDERQHREQDQERDRKETHT